MTENTESIRWGAERRLEFIEFRVYWEGYVNRNDLTKRFGVSTPQASTDLSLYQRLAPENIQYDSSAKRYVGTEHFQPRILRPNADRYLAQLRGMADGIITSEETWINHAPAIDAMTIPQRKVEPAILKGILAAIRSRRSVEIRYQSMNKNRPEAAWRHITPHAFGFDGLRWHVRAFCHEDHKFKDFVLSRCYGVGDFAEPGATPMDDIKWNTFVDVILEPNPALSHGQRSAVALDYCMDNGQLKMSIRQSLLFYFNERLRLDVPPSDGHHAKIHVVVVNREEFLAALQTART